MIQEIKGNKQLLDYLKDTIEDEGISVEIADNITEDKIVIIKVDEYYNNLHLATPPKAIDFLVLVDCECDAYVMYLLELKNVKNPKFLMVKNIHEKFSNTMKDFMTEKFGGIFLNDKYKYKEVLLYLISDAYGIGGRYQNFEEYRKIMNKMNKRDSLKVERSLGSKLFKFRGRVLRISFDIPPNPVIRKIS